MICGKKNWIIPDCELPPEGEGVLKGHESVIIVNDSPRAAKIKVTLFFDDKDAYEGIEWRETLNPSSSKFINLQILSFGCGCPEVKTAIHGITPIP